MKRFLPVKTNTGMLAVKVNYPCPKLFQTIDLITEMLSDYGTDYKIIDFGLSSSGLNTSYVKFNTNLPWDVFKNK